MAKFEIGDIIKRTSSGSNGDVLFNGEYTITGFTNSGGLIFKECKTIGSDTDYFTLIKKKGAEMSKTIWEVIIVDKTKDKILIREVIIDGDEKSVCAKVSISFADKLKDIIFDNLHYITTKLGSYEVETKK